MGVELTKVSMKWAPETVECEAELLDAFSGLVEGRSHMSRIAYKIARAAVRTMGIVRVIEEFVQDKPRAFAPDLVGQSIPEFPVIETGLTKKPLTRIAASEGSGARRREVNGVSRRSLLDGLAELGAFNLLSFSKLQRSKFNSYVRRVA